MGEEVKVKKMTKRENYVALKEILESSNADNVVELVEFIDAQIAQLDKKAETAKAKSAERKAEGDELRARVLNVITEDYQTVDDIYAQVPAEADEELSKSKIIARLTQLVNNGDIEKADAKDENGKTKKVYKLAE